MNGVFILDKPETFTSFDAVAVMRHLLGERKIGHTGTLDPMATGVLPLLLGKGTRAIPFLEERPKTYRAEFSLGKRTDTLDRTGQLLEENEKSVPEEALRETMRTFEGEILQVPPMYSAIRKNGVRLYDLARQGVEVERSARPVTIYRLKLLEYDEKTRSGALELTCSKGTYVRTLIDDIGKKCGCCGGVMMNLRRLAAAGFSIDMATPLLEAKTMEKEELLKKVLPIEALFREYPKVIVSKAQAKRFLNGGWLDPKRFGEQKFPKDTPLRIKSPEGQFLGLGEWQEDALRVLKIFMDQEELK